MPKLYEYFGLVILFYANEHEPVHVHARCQGREGRAEFVIINGEIVDIRFGSVAGRPPLTHREMQYFKELVQCRAEDIVQKWIDFFVLNKPIRAERITSKAEMMQKIVNIVQAESAGDYRLRLVFDDGTEQTVDFISFLSRSRHPDIRAFLDQERFLSYRLEYGELIWGDYDLCFPILDLYNNRLEHFGENISAA